MLVDIKIKLSNIVRENNKLANEMESLRNTETVSRNWAERRKKKGEEIAELYLFQDNLEQYTRKQFLEVCGIPDGAYSSTKEAVLKLAESIDVPIITRRHKNFSHSQEKRRRYHPSEISEPQSEKQILQSKNQIKKHQATRCILKGLDYYTHCNGTGPNFHQWESHNLQKGISEESEW